MSILQTFALRTIALSIQDGCLEQTSHLSPVTTRSTTMADKLIVCETPSVDWQMRPSRWYHRSIWVRQGAAAALSSQMRRQHSICASNIIMYVWNQPWSTFSFSLRRWTSLSLSRLCLVFLSQIHVKVPNFLLCVQCVKAFFRLASLCICCLLQLC